MKTFFISDYNEKQTLITASHVVFRERKGKRAPIAAVGYQILHRTLNRILQTFTVSLVDET